jgi:hypothetical protein
LTPLGQGSGAGLLEDVAAVEVTVVVEVVVDRGVNGGELLQGLQVPEFRHRALSSSKRLMRVFSSVVEPSSAPLTLHHSNGFHRGGVRPKTVSHESLLPTIAFHRALQELERSLAIPTLRGEDLKDLAFVIHGAPEVVHLPIDPDEHFIQVPAPSGIRPMPVDAPLFDFRGEYRTEPIPPEPNRFMADIDATFEQQIFDLP